MNRRFNIAVLWLVDPKTGSVLTGGMERWCRDVASLAKSRGYEVRIFQKSPTHFVQQLAQGVTVYGVPASMNVRGNPAVNREMSKTLAPAEPVLYVSQELALPRPLGRAVAVNHGIWWDGDFPWYKRSAIKILQKRWLDAFRAIICVDTNYINWCHAEFSGRKVWAEKLRYIPNYADARFSQVRAAGRARTASRRRILFPRRLHGDHVRHQGRGAGLLLDAAAILERAGLDLELEFVGRGDLSTELGRYAAGIGLRAPIHTTELALDDMVEAYSRADVVVVPSIAHEGTSLAAVEGILSGRPVVVTHIGGLCNIVIDRLNGFVSDLSPAALAAKIHEALAACEWPQDAAAVLDRCDVALGKQRWERAVWDTLQDAMGLG